MAHNLGGGWFEAKLFTRTIPQVSQGEPAVRYAIMAVGALAHARARTTSIMHIIDHTHYTNALDLYGRALPLIARRPRQGLNEGSTLRAVVLSCILFITFGFLHDDRNSACRHIAHGLMILAQFSSDNESAGVSRLPPTSSDVEVEYTDKSPSPLVLEDEVTQIFQRLDHQSWSMAILNPARLPPSIGYPASATHAGDRIPRKFYDLVQARQWWDRVQQGVLHFSRTAAGKLAAMMKARPHLAEDLDFSDVEGVWELQTKYLVVLERWNAAFVTLYTSTRDNREADMAAFYRAVSLRLQYLASWTCGRAVWFSCFDAIYSLTPYFREIVRLSAILLPQQHKDRGGSEVFTIDNGPTMALFIVAVKCRDRKVRGEALSLLEMYHRRDGLWDSRMCTAIAKKNKDVEIMNETDGDLPEQWRRLRKREVILEDERVKECTMRFCVKDEQGNWQLSSENIKW